LGYSPFTRLSEKLGLKDIFGSKQSKLVTSIQVTNLQNCDLRGSVMIIAKTKRQETEGKMTCSKTTSNKAKKLARVKGKGVN